ncbi:Pyrimidine-specific ribonucleoside hydrolase RihB [bioreactor metagenome]|uniref:Pyrimidine-specific ribonucleoside hydrolase RihB n=1 Tax=bioreactor metagenome TaxID=1076179 RepID=A0A645BWA9_9ZZZZ
MTTEQLLKNLQVPKRTVDVVLDTDAYNEIDDQFAIAYLLKSADKLTTKALYAAPFHNGKSYGPEDGMLKSYDEIFKLLDLAEIKDFENHVYKGSTCYLSDENTPVISPAAEDLAKRALSYSADNPLYVVAIGAITNVASALLINPQIKENIVVVWLGGHAHHYPNTKEFNMFQDVAAARVVMNSGVPFVQLPCMGVVSTFTVSGPELTYWLKGKNALADYLAENTIAEAASYAKNKIWSRVIWDVTAVAWLLNDNNRFMNCRLEHTPIPEYDHRYGLNPNGQLMCYTYNINRDNLMNDLFEKLTK